MSWLFWTSALATDRHVPSVYGSLADAVSVSMAGDAILVDALAYIPPEPQAVEVSHALSVRGINGRPVLRGDDTDGLFAVIDGAAVTFESIAYDGLSTTPFLHIYEGTVTLQDVIISDTFRGGNGGAILSDGDLNILTVDSSTLERGEADDYGGLIAALGGAVTLRHTIFSSSLSGTRGGAIYASGATLVIEDSKFLANSTANRGGALALFGMGLVDIKRTHFEGNSTTADRGGGALYTETSPITVADSWFLSNTAGAGSEGGGAIFHQSDAGTYRRLVFCSNSAVAGGAFLMKANTANLENSVFLENTASASGGAVHVGGGIASLSHCSVALSSAPNGAAAFSKNVLSIADTYIADHTGGAAVKGEKAGEASSSHSAYTRNTVDLENTTVDDPSTDLFVDSLIGTPTLALCEPLELIPPVGSPLLGAASDGSDIGAFSGPWTWSDLDSDGVLSLYDCDDNNAAISPDASEIIGDSIDQDCDGIIKCYLDADLDGFGEDISVESLDRDCLDATEAASAEDICPDFDDNIDTDDDNIPDGCDDCPTDPNPDCVPPTDTDTDGDADTDADSDTDTDTDADTDADSDADTDPVTGDRSTKPPEIAVGVGCACDERAGRSPSLAPLVLLGLWRRRKNNAL